MFEKLSPKGRRILFNSIVAFAIMLFIIGFIIGKHDESNAESANNELQNNVEEKTNVANDKLKNFNEDKKTKKEEAEPMDEYEEEDPADDVEEQEINTLEDYFSKDEIKKAKQTSEKFVSTYYPFDGDNPTKNADKAIKYCTDKLKQELTNQITRPTNDFYSRKTKEISVYEPYKSKKDEMVFNVRVTGEVYNAKGKKVRTENVEYQLVLVPDGDTFKVDEYLYSSLR